MKDVAVELEEEILRRTTLQSSAVFANNQRSHVDSEGTDSNSSNTTGVQLLSPTLVDSFRCRTTRVPKSSRKSEYFGWSRSPIHSPIRTRVVTPHAQSSSDNQTNHDKPKSAKAGRREERSREPFNFDGLTLAAMRDRLADERLAASLCMSERIASTSRPIRKVKGNSGSKAQIAAHFRPDRSMPVLGSFDDEELALFAPATFDAQYQQFQLQQQEHRSSTHEQRAARRRGSSGYSSSISSSTGMADATSPSHSSFTAANSIVDAPGSRHRSSSVLADGWLEKRKGLVLKRWRAFYCVFKADDSLCLYASEDTVNGRLELRLTVLRVLLTDKSDSFHVIAVDSDGAARREELRASVSVEWQRWFLVFRRFFDEDSLHEALLRKPELLLLQSPVHPPPSMLLGASSMSSERRRHQSDGNQFDNNYHSVEAGAEPTAARHADKPRTACKSTALSRVEPLPSGRDGGCADNSKKPPSLGTMDGLGWHKSADRESLGGSSDELRSTVSLHSPSFGNQPTAENCMTARSTIAAAIGWSSDLDSEHRAPASEEKPCGKLGNHDEEPLIGWSW